MHDHVQCMRCGREIAERDAVGWAGSVYCGDCSPYRAHGAGQETKRGPKRPAPLLWLLGQAGVVILALWVLGWLKLRMTPDSPAYLEFDFSSAEAALGSIRTVGYPLFVEMVRTVSPRLTLLPLVQSLLHVLSVVLFFRALKMYGFSPWAALVAASPLLYSHTFIRCGALAASDLPALSMAVICVSLMILAAATGSVWAWIGAVVAAFLAWQIRPIYQFLVLTVPVCGTALVVIRKPEGSKARAAWLGLLLLSVLAGPLLGWCALRKAVVGDFGAGSFRGYPLVGITAQLLRDEDVERLPEDLRPLARSFQEERRKRGVRNPVVGSTFSYEVLAGQYDEHVFPIRAAAVRAACGEGHEMNGPHSVKVDRMLWRLGTATILLAPLSYARWVWLAFAHGVGTQLTYSLCLPLSVLAIALHLLLYGRIRRRGPASSPVSRASAPELAVIALLAFGFFLPHLLATVLLIAPWLRYSLAAGAFLPSLLALDVSMAWRRLR